MNRLCWDRKMWGVTFTGDKVEKMLIGTMWDSNVSKANARAGEPTRALLFTTRALARDWCRAKMQQYEGRTDCCATWKFSPVRVRETVRV